MFGKTEAGYPIVNVVEVGLRCHDRNIRLKSLASSGTMPPPPAPLPKPHPLNSAAAGCPTTPAPAAVRERGGR